MHKVTLWVMYDHGCSADILQMAPTDVPIQDAGDVTASSPHSTCGAVLRCEGRQQEALDNVSPVVICWNMTKVSMAFH